MGNEDSGPYETTVRTFQFSITPNSPKISVPLEIPYKNSLDDLCVRVCKDNKVPEHKKSAIETSLKKFIAVETSKLLDRDFNFYPNLDDSLINNVINQWEEAFTENTVQYRSEKFGSDDFELFSTVYHKLVHSPVLETILQVEHTYALVVQDLTNRRNKQLALLSDRQTAEISKALEDGLNMRLSDGDITAIAGRHSDEHDLELARWGSQLEAAHNEHRREYREWLMTLLEQSCDSPLPTPVASPLSFGSLVPHALRDTLAAPSFQESFTIHLGSQMKQMYNIRILSADVLDFCRPRKSEDGSIEPQPQRLQTSLALYSNDLCGLVLLTDNYLGGFSGITKDFIQVCEMSTELHFNSVENQLESIKDSIKEGIEWRKHNAACDTNLLTSMEQQSRKSGTKYLQTGDVFLTKHSNLAEVHVVFHMVVDDTIKSNDINSRHPGILGVRNIMKCACSNDITTLTIPLLLTHDLSEEMTLQWCTRRAELVYKCVKGFMIEMASWGGSELKNVQFLVPMGISEDIFNALANMLPSIFRVSNPLVLKPSSSPTIYTTRPIDKKNSK